MLYNPMITQHLSFPSPVPFLQFLRRHRTPDWCRSQLRCLVIRRLVEMSEITVSKTRIRQRIWLRHFRTNRKAAGSISERVVWILY
jgi:hypothetical protein